MRALPIAALLLFATAAHAGEPGISLRLASARQTAPSARPENLPPRREVRWERSELLGEALGRWLGVRDGRWDLFDASLLQPGEGGPVLAGTVRKNAAEIQLRWRPDE